MQVFCEKYYPTQEDGDFSQNRRLELSHHKTRNYLCHWNNQYRPESLMLKFYYWEMNNALKYDNRMILKHLYQKAIKHYQTISLSAGKGKCNG